MLLRKASYLNLTMRAYDYIIVTEIITNVLAGLIYGEYAWAYRSEQSQNMADWLVFS